MENTKDAQQIKFLARTLRLRLQGRVPQDIVDRLSDEALVQKYDDHHQIKLSVAAARADSRRKAQ